VWLLWSIKESAYKYLKRNNPGLLFSPTKIIIQNITYPDGLLNNNFAATTWDAVSDDAFYSGKLVFASHNLCFRSIISTQWINTAVAGDEKFEHIYWGMGSIASANYDDQSKAARALLLNKLSPFFPGDLKIERSVVGYPVILKDNEDLSIPASLSHDGNFVAYCFNAEND